MANGDDDETESIRSFCRICYEGDQKAELVSPCSCSGDMGFVHVSCLERWLNERNVDSCEHCGERFQISAPYITALRLLPLVWRKKWFWRSLSFEVLCFVVVILVAALVCVLMAILAFYLEGAPWFDGFYFLVVIIFLVAFVVLTLKSLRIRRRRVFLV
ncbi:hypothetical protein MTO96_018152 [Rhipicephalus appendiculatus]